jgi:hypothetical protein
MIDIKNKLIKNIILASRQSRKYHLICIKLSRSIYADNSTLTYSKMELFINIYLELYD